MSRIIVDSIRNSSASSDNINLDSSGNVGVNTTAPVEKFGVAGNMRFVNPTGTTRRIIALPSGGYNLGTTGGAAIAFHRISDGGGGSDEITFETHWQGNRHGESARISKFGGITFNGDTAAANALDDYEEGTFTPSIYYQNTSGLTISTNSASAKYTKIGRIVWIIGAINWTVSGSPVNDNVAILGLPFATNTGEVSTNSTRFAGANITLQNTSDQSSVYMVTGYGNNGLNLAVQQDLGNRSNELGENSGMIVMFQLWYHTA